MLAGLAGCGCYDLSSDCELNYTCEPGDGTGGACPTTTTSTTIDPSCIPSNVGVPIENECGVFVSATGDDTNDGTKAAPKKTLAAALAASKGAPVYACTDGISEAIMLSEDATIYGGLDCANGWAYVGSETKTPWTADADAIPLRIATGARATLEDIAISAADAVKAGGSSIAVLSEVGTQLALARCDVSAGTGADGAVGETPVEAVMNGVDGKAGKEACLSEEDQTGGSAVPLSCDGTAVNSGAGGIGTLTDGGPGGPGKPNDVATGLGGSGQQDMPATACTIGGDGAAGMAGEAGTGAPQVLGTLGPTGFAGVSGVAGKAGLPGQGGGGGGGGKVCATIQINSNPTAGASGGSGGTGACGGAGGKGGSAGGSSIGIVSLGAKLTLDTVTLTAKKGGAGGDGGAGQLGGAGGQAGAAGLAKDGSTACAGGKGGDGGPGGQGGGGLGGHSLGLAHVGEAPDVAGATIKVDAPGPGGLGDGDTNNGAAGVAAKVQQF